jgi:hypothetical protein
VQVPDVGGELERSIGVALGRTATVSAR